MDISNVYWRRYFSTASLGRLAYDKRLSWRYIQGFTKLEHIRGRFSRTDSGWTSLGHAYFNLLLH